MSSRHNNIQSVKNKHQRNNPQLVTQTASATFYSGVLPQADELQKYEHILPGLADRIMKQAERQTANRINLETIAVKGGNRRAFLGTIFGFVIGMSGIAAGTYLVIAGYGLEGLTSFLGPLAALLLVYLKGIKSNKEEREFRRNK